ncbi:MAG: hypothetical protein N4A32_08915 [Marinifilaceae bacterium]|jgi:hypothetical protein|nr:hypothetical protein [Marinifilaceae bacterium]
MKKNVITSLFTISLIAMLFCFQSCKKSDNDNSPSLENISGIWKIISNNGRAEKAPYDYVVISKNSLKFNSYINETGKLAIKEVIPYSVSDITNNSFKIRVNVKYVADKIKEFEEKLKSIKDIDQIKEINDSIEELKKASNFVVKMTYKKNDVKLSLKSEIKNDGKIEHSEMILEKATKLPL